MANTHHLKKPVSEQIQEFAADASLAISVGDLMYLDTDDAKPASSQADKLSEVLNQAEFAKNFCGVSNSARLASDASAGVVRVQTDGLIELPCSSSTFEIGDLVGAVEQSNGTQLEPQKVKKTTIPRLAIGVVVKRYASATTKVWVRLISRVSWNIVGRQNLGPAGQGTGSTVIPDADTALTVDQGPFFSSVPTAARIVTLPTEAQSAGLMLFIANNSAGANSLTVKNAAATTIATVAQNKRGIFWCDGTTWFGGPTA